MIDKEVNAATDMTAFKQVFSRRDDVKDIKMNNTDHSTDTASQCKVVLNWLQCGPLTTLEAREKLFIMSIAARIFELKSRGHNITTQKIPAGRRKIAQYVLLNSTTGKADCND